MNTSLRTSLLLVTAIGSLAVAGCRESQPAADILAEDSSLAVAVLSANQDTLALADADTLSIEPISAPIAAPVSAGIATAEKPEVAAPAASRDRSSRSSLTASKRSVRKSNNSGVVRTARQSGSISRNPERLVAVSGRRVPSPTRTPMRATAMIPAGSELIFSASEKVCAANATVGDRFNAETAEDLIGPLGVVIPKGALASGEIVSRGNNKQDAVLRIQSLTVRGRTYSMSSETTDAQLDNIRTGKGRTKRVDRCVPAGGRINARLTEPLRVSLTE